MLAHLELMTLLGVIVVGAPMVLVTVLGVTSLLGRPLGERTVSRACQSAIVIGLTTDAAWARRYAGDPSQPAALPAREEDDEDPPGIVHTGWGPVLGVILALMVGGGVLMGTIAFSVQKIFEW